MLVLILPASAFLVCLFIIQHDCGHGCYFNARWTNNLLGRVIGVFTLTPSHSGATITPFITLHPAISPGAE